MSFRYRDLAVDLSGIGICGQATAWCGEATATGISFCPTASAGLDLNEPSLPDLAVLRDQLRAALGR